MNPRTRFTLVYRFESETPPVKPMRLKIEVNNGENFHVFELEQKPIEHCRPLKTPDGDTIGR